jgi:hypothetical protein
VPINSVDPVMHGTGWSNDSLLGAALPQC